MTKVRVMALLAVCAGMSSACGGDVRAAPQLQGGGAGQGEGGRAAESGSPGGTGGGSVAGDHSVLESGTGGGAEAAVPGCLRELVAACTCQGPGICGGQQTCFSVGVTTATTVPDGGPCNFSAEYTETKVFKADGSLCYSVRSLAGVDTACESASFSWLDAAGQVVASADGFLASSSCGSQTPPVTCAATGENGVAPLPWPIDCPANACP